MKIVEYEDKYLESVKDLLVELEEYIILIDQDHLDKLSEDYRDKMALIDLKEVKDNNGKCFLAIIDSKVIGLIMGIETKYDDVDYLDYKCPKRGEITELVISKEYRNKGIGEKLIKKIEDYFKSIGIEYVIVDVFSYNKNGVNFYEKNNYHNRMQTMIKKL